MGPRGFLAAFPHLYIRRSRDLKTFVAALNLYTLEDFGSLPLVNHLRELFTHIVDEPPQTGFVNHLPTGEPDEAIVNSAFVNLVCHSHGPRCAVAVERDRNSRSQPPWLLTWVSHCLSLQPLSFLYAMQVQSRAHRPAMILRAMPPPAAISLGV
ncbi:hypothetical protein PENSPDRAFT_346296 [Peniophora sp. CONT]|nr:hypothetical protein PENSPDRAFT_346296 [Peniophora sp. CONT]